jgi:hypothetical protein
VTTPPRRKRTRAGSTVAVEDAQLVDADDLGAPPRARVAVHDASADHVGVARATIDQLGHAIAVAGAGAPAVKKIVDAMRSADPPDVVIIGLPGGEPILDAARALAPRRPVLVAAIGGPAATAADRAHAAGADLVTRRPHDGEHLGPVLMAAAALAGEHARLVVAQGTEAMLRARLAKEDTGERETGLHTIESFHRVLEVELKRAKRFGYALSVCHLAIVPPRIAPTPAITHELHVRAAAAIRAAIRDIDFPVEIGEDRFLVLLPYTDATGASIVARRIAAAAQDKTLRANGALWTPALAIGVAGTPAGQAISMAALMRGAADALRASLRRGGDLVVAS